MNSKISQIYKSDLKEIKELGQMAWVIDMNSLVVLTPGGLAFSKPHINNTAEIVVLQRKVDILDKSILSTNEGLAALGSGGSGGGDVDGTSGRILNDVFFADGTFPLSKPHAYSDYSNIKIIYTEGTDTGSSFEIGTAQTINIPLLYALSGDGGTPPELRVPEAMELEKYS